MAKLPAVSPLFVGEFLRTPMIMWKSPRTQELCPTESLEEVNVVGDKAWYEPVTLP